eukprot:866110-Rhodomonas_salina.1
MRHMREEVPPKNAANPGGEEDDDDGDAQTRTIQASNAAYNTRHACRRHSKRDPIQQVKRTSTTKNSKERERARTTQTET